MTGVPTGTALPIHTGKQACEPEECGQPLKGHGVAARRGSARGTVPRVLYAAFVFARIGICRAVCHKSSSVVISYCISDKVSV